MSNARNLSGQNAIVTGGARGLGLGIARRLSELGAKVAVWDNNPDEAAMRAGKLTPDDVQQVDISNLEAVEAAFDRTRSALGSVQILVNNAGINGPVQAVWDYPAEEWNRVFSVNVNGVFHCCRTIVPHMREQAYGRIVNISSIAGKEGVQYIAAYSAAKAAVIGFTKSIAKELARDGVLVNCVAPSMAETDLLKEMTAEHISATKAKIPMGRLLQIEEAANMVGWIVGPECSFTTGFTFDLSGGRATY